MLKESELLQLKRRGIAPADFEREMENFKKGFPFLKIVNAATPIKGIKVLDNKEITQAFKSFDSFSFFSQCGQQLGGVSLYSQ